MADNIITINDSGRTAKRKQQKSLGSSAVAYLVELITNADDSYKRLESSGQIDKESVKVIYIDLAKKQKGYVFSVTDNAEGMTRDRVVDIFSKYGGDNAGGDSSSSRGIFGQGATDVMINAALDGKEAMLESIKDDSICRFYFGWDSQSSSRSLTEKKVNLNKSQIDDYRNNIKIPNNGTKMTFGVPSIVTFKEKNIIDDLEGAFALRYILDSPNRKVIFAKNGGVTHELSSKKFRLNDDSILEHKAFDFDYENKKLKCDITLYKNDDKKKYSSYRNDIMVTDSNQVIYDNTMFGFEKFAKAKDISGVLKIDGLYDLCKQHLNQENPDEIINDDRTGFNTKHDFYKQLCKQKLDKIISDCISAHSSPTEEVDITKNKKFKSALTEINKWMSEELKRDIPGGGEKGKNPPADGLDFAKPKINVTVGVSYDLKLIINPKLISYEDDIDITIESDDDYISYSPDTINYGEADKKGEIVVKSIAIHALKTTPDENYVILTASCKGYSKSIAICVVDADVIYPQDGIEFELGDVTFVPNGNHKSVVWFDTEVLKFGDVINCSSDGLNILNNDIVLSEKMIVVDNIGKFTIISSGGTIGNDYKLMIITPSGLVREQLVHIRKDQVRDNGSKGMITAIKLYDGDETDTDFQITFEEKTGTIYINPYSPVNIAMMGDLSNVDPEKPVFNKKQTDYIADLLSYHCALIDVKELERKNDITINEDERLEDYNKNIGAKKAIIFNRILKALSE